MFTHFFVIVLTICLASCHHQSVIIIGAGSSGIAAATRLLSHNITDITILEAEDRIGGRVHTIPCGDHNVVELGATWIYGMGGNVVYEMMKDKNLLSMLLHNQYPADIAFSNGKAVGTEKTDDLIKIFMEIMNSPDVEADKMKTTGEHFVPAFTAAVNKKFHDDPESVAVAMKTLPVMESLMAMIDSSFSWNDTSAVTNYKVTEGEMEEFITFKGKGFKQMFDIMSGKIPGTSEALPLDEKMHFKKMVSKINYSEDKPVVTCTDGSEHTADFVLFTPSLGVLKHDHETMFEPSLPEDKIAAINDLGMGADFKVILHYDNPWWNKDNYISYHFAFNADDEEEIAELFPGGPMKHGKPWLTSFLGILPGVENPNVIYCWFTGENVPEMENMSDEDVLKGINYVFTKFLGHKYTLTKPDKITKTDWYKNPHFRGMASYETLKSHRDGECVHMILAKPLKNKDGHEVVFFAGEATHMSHYATVHGAVESGYREADRMIKIHNDSE